MRVVEVLVDPNRALDLVVRARVNVVSDAVRVDPRMTDGTDSEKRLAFVSVGVNLGYFSPP